MLLGLSDALPSLVEAKFKSAHTAKSLLFSSTELAIIHTTTGLPDNPPAPKVDPFENPSDDLLITNIPTSNPSHFLVLNKYPVIADHFILATKLNKQQTHILQEDDLAATYACLKAWNGQTTDGTQRRLFAFFNSGEHSGASQPHRHLQFLPVETMRSSEKSSDWDLLMDQIVDSPESIDLRLEGLKTSSKAPFANFGVKLPSTITDQQLHQAYLNLYDAAASRVRAYIKSHPDDLELHSTEGGSSPISYNLAMTTSAMVLCPRRKEGSMLRRDDGSEVGFVMLNGTLLSGSLIVKAEEEWEMLKRDAARFDEVLAAIGIPHNNDYTKL